MSLVHDLHLNTFPLEFAAQTHEVQVVVYWFKATFNGSDFFPEVVQEDEANRSFPAGLYCNSLQVRDTTP